MASLPDRDPVSDALRRVADRLRLMAGVVRVAAGPVAALRAIRAAAGAMGSGGAGREAVAVPMRTLGGEALWIRPGTSDLSNAVAQYSHGLHRPAPEVVPEGAVVELGSNCGAVLAALGTELPGVRLLGVEPDAGNAAAARRNTERFGERCEIVNSAVWSETTELVVVPSAEHGDHGVTVRPVAPGDDPGWQRLAAITVDDLLEQHLPAGTPVGYMHVSIEGSEPEVFAAGGRWPTRVRSLRVEVHPYFGYTGADCIAQLEALGYRAWIAPDPPDKWVHAVRDEG